MRGWHGFRDPQIHKFLAWVDGSHRKVVFIVVQDVGDTRNPLGWLGLAKARAAKSRVKTDTKEKAAAVG